MLTRTAWIGPLAGVSHIRLHFSPFSGGRLCTALAALAAGEQGSLRSDRSSSRHDVSQPPPPPNLRRTSLRCAGHENGPSHSVCSSNRVRVAGPTGAVGAEAVAWRSPGDSGD